MQSLVIKGHSIVDVITNSSSELFVCNTKKSSEFIRDFLSKMLDLYNEGNETQYKFEDCFGSISQVTEEGFEDFFDQYVIDWGYKSWSWGVPNQKDRWDFSDEYKKVHRLEYKYPYMDHLEWNRSLDKQVEDAWDAEVAKYKEENYEKIKSHCIGLVLINSKSDNSIPFGLFELIETTFNAERIHLG